VLPGSNAGGNIAIYEPLVTSDILLIKMFYLCVIKSLNSKGYNHFNN